MFFQIFLFEIRYRLRRPAFYMYFGLVFLFTALTFAAGNLPSVEREYVNAPAVIAFFSCLTSVFLMLVSSSIMGVPLYRDIEHNTKEYYLSYPITKPGYFWGRYLGSYGFVVLIGAGFYVGAWVGCKLGPVLGWTAASHYGPDHFQNYCYPFLTIMLPNLFFTSSIFFGLVAIFRNVKVIYSSGLFLFLGYIIGNFFLHNIHDLKVIYLCDPFLTNGMQNEISGYPLVQLNGSVVRIHGLLLTNRIIWISVGVVVLLYTYWRFSFERFFGGVSGKRKAVEDTAGMGRAGLPYRGAEIRFEGSYYRKTLYSLTRIELQNIIKDNYFWIILSGGLIFLSFVFWHGPGRFGVSDYPRTVFIMEMFDDIFPFFVFLILIFYTGETVHREQLTRFAFINDALPPPTWVLNSAKLLSLCCLAIGLSMTPVVLGLGIQLLKGYTHFNFPMYCMGTLVVTLPKLIGMVLFSYAIHIVVNNKFAAMGIGVTIWTAIFVMNETGYITYHLFLYPYGPGFALSDMDGIGHLLGPVLWFNGYWLLAGALMVVTGSLFYARGVASAFKERWRLAATRWRGATRVGFWLLLAGFLTVGGYIYYNVSYVNNYLTKKEKEVRRVVAEQQLKARYAGLPLPKITRVLMYADLYPAEQQERTRAYLTIMNKGDRPIDSLLLDGDEPTEYTVRYNGKLLDHTLPLYFQRGKYNLFRPAMETSDYRVYRLPASLMPGDTAVMEINSLVAYRGFQNSFYAVNLLHNGIFFTGGVPGLGYDEDEEIGSNEKRKEYGLPVKIYRDIPQDDPEGMRSLLSGNEADLLRTDITVSTAGDQTAVAPGELTREWEANGRRYFRYVQEYPGFYLPISITSARYVIHRDTVHIPQGPAVYANICYDPANGANVNRFASAYRDGLTYYSKAFGPYPFRQANLIECSPYGPWIQSGANTTYYTERVGWNADLREPGKFDYCYYNMAEQLAHQWWGSQRVVPNQTVGSQVVRDGLSKYAAIILMEKKYGKEAGIRARENEREDYFRGRHGNFGRENDLLHANRGYEGNSKGGLVLYGLRGLIGEDSLNAAIQEFGKAFAFRDGGIYAGSRDLYKILQVHVPDSFRYYLTDTWERVCFYDNRVKEATATPSGNAGEYIVSMTFEINKRYNDSTGKESLAREMNDYIDIEVSGASGQSLYQERRRFTAGEHRIVLVVKGRPERVSIDPWMKLIERQPEDNQKMVEMKVADGK